MCEVYLKAQNSPEALCHVISGPKHLKIQVLRGLGLGFQLLDLKASCSGLKGNGDGSRGPGSWVLLGAGFLLAYIKWKPK